MPEGISDPAEELVSRTDINFSSPKTKQIQELVDALAVNYLEISRDKSGERKKSTQTGRDLPGHDLSLYRSWLAEAHRHFSEASRKDLALTLASEWVLDNYYVIRQALQLIGEDLPTGYYQQLPRLAGGPLKEFPRIYAIGRSVIAYQNHLFNPIDLQSIMVQLQERVPLTMGELWALPIFLRYSLIETLANTLVEIIHPENRPHLPAPAALLPFTSETASPRLAVDDDSTTGGIVANIILSLRSISEQDWNDFFEGVSCAEQKMREDPAGIYSRMDFKTRDLYRKEVESLSFATGKDENALAEIVIDLARQAAPLPSPRKGNNPGSPPGGNGSGGTAGEEPPARPEEPGTPLDPHLMGQRLDHVGEYLLGKGRAALEERIGYRPDFKTACKRWGKQHASALYLTSILLVAMLILLILGALATHLPASAPLLAILLLVPVLTIATNLVNWLITLLIPPTVLPKLDFKDGIPAPFQTLVVIPALITSREEIDTLIRQLELHYLRNPEPGLLFALLTDFSDADSEVLPEDEDLVQHATEAIESLNARYESSSPFYFLHRKRLWNPSEGKWMGWERKRGKLHELNLLLRRRPGLSFITLVGDMEKPCDPGFSSLECVRFVITLDADTILPRGAACRLAGTLAHPLNRAVFNDTTGRVVSGYTVLQPRMEIHPQSVNLSWFTRIFAGDTGLDLYSRAVSDAYQDLFGEGSFVGKGIYDVDAFERSVDEHMPENSVLSHDLLEGLMGRAGLVTDITMIEDYPPSYFAQVMRQRRWIRGDWQLLPWLVQPGKFGVIFSAVDRWKMIDNLLRALLAPALLLVFILGYISLPGHAGLWTAVILFSFGIPLLTSLTRSTLQAIGGEPPGAAFHPVRWTLVRWVLAVAFLPYEAYIALDAIITTLYRLFVSHRNLLQWTTAAQTARIFGLRTRQNPAWQKLIASALLVSAMAGVIQLIYALNGVGMAPALVWSAPVLLLWLISPLIARWINQPLAQRKAPLSEEQVRLLRRVSRRTWGFFERFVGPEDHWLPPDNYQESPVGRVAHHTSPTNIGLLLTSTLAAYDMGYLDQLGLITRLATTMDTLDRLERFRGHFLNWYDTLTLQPLTPRYVSTVDSGNLAASLIVIAQACKTMPDQAIFRWELWQGYLDALANLNETLTGMRKEEYVQEVEEISRRIAEIRAEILAERAEPWRWYALFQRVSGPFWQNLSHRLMELIRVGQSALDLGTLRKLQEVTAQVERHHLAVQRTLTELVPWIPLLEQLPMMFNRPQFVHELTLLRAHLLYNPPLNKIYVIAEKTSAHIQSFRDLIKSISPTAPAENDQERAALEWLDNLEQACAQAVTNSRSLLDRFAQIAARTEQYVSEMNFNFLYHSQRRIFHLGFNLDTGQLDRNFYDLLASEARITSIIAIAKGDVPPSHWLQLSRPVTKVEGSYVLLSWSATMFEYLMPSLFLTSYPGTLLAESLQGVVLHQIAYGKAKDVPWGISESGFYRFDASQNYQYRAFGVPGLGFKRGLADDLVIAPYASLMAIGYAPQAVARNLADLTGRGMLGLYGLYEALDFTAERLPAGETSAVIYEYMAHHQGMALMAMANFFHRNVMVRRMTRDPRIQGAELFMQEQVPLAAPLQNPFGEDVKGTQRLADARAEIHPWSVPVQTPIPEVHLLSNGSYNVLLSNMGGGYSSWRDVDLTRWQPDEVLDPWGTWIYVKENNPDSSGGKLWSTGFQPVPGDRANVQVTFFAHMVVYRRTEDGITSTLEVTVPPDDPVEIRRLHLHNTSERPRSLRLASYGEVILTQQANDARHPGFNKLFIETEFVPELDLQIFKRRPRSNQETPVYLGHMMVFEDHWEAAGGQATVQHEADRYRFIGRGRTPCNPAALELEERLSGTTGATLDPIFSLGQELELKPHGSVELAYLTFAGESREAILALARRFRSWTLVERSFSQADIAAQSWLGKQALNTQALQEALQVLSALLYPFKVVRASPETLSANRLGQPGLWRFAISGDYPILLVELEESRQIDLVRQVLEVHKYLRNRSFLLDVVILNCQKTNYGAEMRGKLYRLVHQCNSDQWLYQRGGIFILHADQMRPEERTLLQTAARVFLNGAKGSLGEQLPGYSVQVHHLPELVPTRQVEAIAEISGAERSEEGQLPPTGALHFANGFGGFSADGREYIIELSPGRLPPAPWTNVIGYPHFGFMVTEGGSQCTWAMNSGENRLTPWSNDPVRDPTGEALYLRDEETGEVWTPTPLPAAASQPYRITHGAGYTIFDSHSHGLRQHLTLFASPEDPVKIYHLKVENTWGHTRRITATQFVEWVLGTTRAASMAYIIPEYDQARECLLAANPYSSEFGDRVAFLIASKPVHGLTADRTEFLGRGGKASFPVALRRMGLETRITPGEDPCAVLQLHLDLLPGAVEEIYFVLGQGSNKEQALSLAEKYKNPAYVGAAWERTQAFWDRLLDTVQVHTPELAYDLVINRWLLYQTLSCRVWGRTAFYQSSGAFGFRDQLQDVLALLPIDPAIPRGQILNAAQHQFEAGDVLHWWHPPSGRGVRTRFSDDLLWLPYVTALYVESTGDASILQEKIPFLQAPPLKQGENERYSQYPPTQESYSLMEHCLRAIAKGATTGSHGLPLIGTGDWNDGLNRVGEAGLGESVWLAWFLCDVLQRFATVCEQVGEIDTAQNFRTRARDYAAAVERSAWDGEWYRRAYYDNGAPLGSIQNKECQIDAIAQSWGVLCGMADPDRSRRAMQSLLARLVRPQDRLSLLFTPPFDATLDDPGYIKGYVPGTRENGGQYTHAAIWTAFAFARLGDGKQAGELFDLLNPINQADTEEKAGGYRVEPYVICADIYSAPPYLRRGGWTWYTGSAAWMYRLGLEAVLGFKKTGNRLRIDPVTMPTWERFEITYRFGKATYQIQVDNSEHTTQHVQQVILDGKLLDDSSIPLVDDGKEHQVEVKAPVLVKSSAI